MGQYTEQILKEAAPLAGKTFHLIGIGGAGMSVVAELLAGEGAQVTGSDRQDSAVLAHLRAKGIGAYFPHEAKRLPEGAIVVVSSAIRDSNPELTLARERGQHVIHRSQALRLAAERHDFVAVAGAHGKTTTSAMIAVGLLRAGLDPSFAIGGPVLGEGSGARVGTGPFVAEADESDGSFLNYRPAVEVITNVEPDHLDHFGSKEAFLGVFEEFVDRLVDGGTVVCCGEDEGSAHVAEYARQLPTVGRVWTYGRGPGFDVSVDDVCLEEDSASATLTFEGNRYPLRLQVTGVHNVLNAAGAWAGCVAVGVEPAAAARALEGFRGAGRRFELVGEVAGRRVYNDYAHHPTEVAAALEQARLVAGEGKVIVVFQPHLYSRTKNFASRFAQALTAADRVILTDIYAAREDPVPGVTSELIAAAGDLECVYVPQAHQAALLAADWTERGDVCVLLGAGDIFLQASAVVERWVEEGSVRP